MREGGGEPKSSSEVLLGQVTLRFCTQTLLTAKL